VIGEPVYVTGNSSGKLLAVWLAANRPDLVKAVVLEDPPLFSSDYPEINYLALKVEVSGFSTKNLSMDRKLSIPRGLMPRQLCGGKNRPEAPPRTGERALGYYTRAFQ
jgi:pimeloyl-ACP methyl ester carboxylesterase